MQSATTKIMTSLSIYIAVFVLIVFIIGSIMLYFFGNLRNVASEIYANTDYSMLNLYLLKIAQTPDISIKNHGLVNNDDISSYYITFQKDDGTTDTFTKIGNIIYYNRTKLCENVDSFKVIVDKSQTQSFSIEVKIFDKIYNSQYALD